LECLTDCRLLSLIARNTRQIGSHDDLNLTGLRGLHHCCKSGPLLTDSTRRDVDEHSSLVCQASALRNERPAVLELAL